MGRRAALSRYILRARAETSHGVRSRQPRSVRRRSVKASARAAGARTADVSRNEAAWSLVRIAVGSCDGRGRETRDATTRGDADVDVGRSRRCER